MAVEQDVSASVESVYSASLTSITAAATNRLAPPAAVRSHTAFCFCHCLFVISGLDILKTFTTAARTFYYFS